MILLTVIDQDSPLGYYGIQMSIQVGQLLYKSMVGLYSA